MEPDPGKQENHFDDTDAKGSNFLCGLLTGKTKKLTREGSSRNDEPVVKVHRDSLFYHMDYNKRGIAVIFNHGKFDISSLKERSGTASDKENLVKCLQSLNFEVQVYDDLKSEAVMDKVEELAQLDHSDYDCFIMCVLTHGDLGILYARDSAYKSELLWTPFTADKCKTLGGKPKLFFFQACQGDRLDSGVRVTQVDSTPTFKIPIHADFLIAYSTIPGFYSWRNTSKGSWFIQALCQELAENSYNVDLLTLLTFVNRRVAIDFASFVPDSSVMHDQKQVPYITFTLTRLVKFKRKLKQ